MTEDERRSGEGGEGGEGRRARAAAAAGLREGGGAERAAANDSELRPVFQNIGEDEAAAEHPGQPLSDSNTSTTKIFAIILLITKREWRLDRRRGAKSSEASGSRDPIKQGRESDAGGPEPIAKQLHDLA